MPALLQQPFLIEFKPLFVLVQSLSQDPEFVTFSSFT
jgi:hypothetical protein